MITVRIEAIADVVFDFVDIGKTKIENVRGIVATRTEGMDALYWRSENMRDTNNRRARAKVRDILLTVALSRAPTLHPYHTANVTISHLRVDITSRNPAEPAIQWEVP